ncbi:MAG: ABC transporter ATP-binding protein [Clostridiales bacterium]|nr:ABC transporter ATP-binding protein [Clostridiales bacterium]
MDEVIRIDGLRKTFKDVVAVDGLDFKVKRGELFAFLGVNGAGKSTTISIMCGQLKKDAGTVLINGMDIDKDFDGVKREIGVVYQNSVLDKVLTVEDNLRDRAALYGIVGADFEKRLKELSEKLEFSDLLKRTVGKLSGGQRRRIDVARALLHEPNILILDEPTTGLDPQTRKRLWNVITNLRKTQGMTVFLTTHYMEEAAEADYVVILDAGKIVAEGTPLQLKNAYTGDFILLYGATVAQLEELGLPYETVVGGYKVAVENTAVATQLIVKNPHIFTDYEVIKGKMDDVFLSATGKKLGATGGESK